MAGKKIDINTATISDLENLSGVGQHRAEAIIRHRRVSFFLFRFRVMYLKLYFSHGYLLSILIWNSFQKHHICTYKSYCYIFIQESGGFHSVVELSLVPGISPAIIEQNKGRIICRRPSPAKKRNGQIKK